MMNALATRQIILGDQAVEVWESPDVPFDSTRQALRCYAASGAWVLLFNALTLRSAPLRAE
jgi:hypothetical protein